jgi:hypothetical protein
MDSGNDPQRIITRVGQFFVSSEDQFRVSVDISSHGPRTGPSGKEKRYAV